MPNADASAFEFAMLGRSIRRIKYWVSNESFSEQEMEKIDFSRLDNYLSVYGGGTQNVYLLSKFGEYKKNLQSKVLIDRRGWSLDYIPLI